MNKIPDFQKIMLPFLMKLKDGNEHQSKDLIDELAADFDLSEDDKKEVLSSGRPLFSNRVGWARTYLRKAELIESPKWTYFSISNRGRELFAKQPKEINLELLKQYPEFLEFYNRKKKMVINLLLKPMQIILR